jgi:hypothetical protein
MNRITAELARDSVPGIVGLNAYHDQFTFQERRLSRWISFERQYDLAGQTFASQEQRSAREEHSAAADIVQRCADGRCVISPKQAHAPVHLQSGPPTLLGLGLSQTSSPPKMGAASGFYAPFVPCDDEAYALVPFLSRTSTYKDW